MISVIIIANSDFGDYAFPLIDSIYYYEKGVEIVLVDNASKKPYKKSSVYKLVRLNEAVGYSKALNIGAENASGDWLVFLNDDVIAIDNFSQMINSLDKNGIYGITSRVKKPAWGCGIEIRYLHGWIQIMHRETYKAIGPFDENLKYFGLDDIDYGWRAGKMGVPITTAYFPFVHVDAHRRLNMTGFTEQMQVSKQYFIEKVNKEREKENVR